MKARICLAGVVMSCAVALAFAAEKGSTDKGKKAADPCAEKYDKSAQTCENEKMNCRARNTDPAECERRYNACIKKAENERKDCETKSGGGGKK